jgi:integrase
LHCARVDHLGLPVGCPGVALPRGLLIELDREFKLRRLRRDPERAAKKLWRWSRTTAWRRVKEIMKAAGINGLAAPPKGLRHGFGVHAFQASVPPHLVQRWLGHASLRTTAIYGDVLGPHRARIRCPHVGPAASIAVGRMANLHESSR